MDDPVKPCLFDYPALCDYLQIMGNEEPLAKVGYFCRGSCSFSAYGLQNCVFKRLNLQNGSFASSSEAKKFLRRIAESNEKMLEELTKPQGLKERAIAVLTTVATAGGVISAVDLIIKWLGGLRGLYNGEELAKLQFCKFLIG